MGILHIRISFIIAVLCSSITAVAQTTLIDPAGDGGFETGTSFAANNWNVVNGTQTNKWFVGTAATGFSGARCAYIGTASTNNSYNISSSSIVHIYRDVTIPAGQPNVTLSFSWKCYGENNYDYMRVYVVPTTTTPVAGTLPLSSQQIGVDYNLTSAWQTTSIGLPCNLAGTTQRIVFSWRNDGGVGTNPPACIDNISLVSSASASCVPSLGTGVTIVPSLPYNSGPGTTCGQGNDLTSANTGVCGSTWYLGGDDVVWEFTPPSSGQITINLNAPTASYTGLMLWQGCPVTTYCGAGSAICLASSTSSTGSKSICANVTAGIKHYIILDSWPAPTCNNFNALTISSVNSGTLGTVCATAEPITSLPYNVTGHSTACLGNDYVSGTTGICNPTYSWGDDKVYEFSVSGPECIGISINNASNNDVGFAVYQGCPGGGGTCIGSAVGATGGTLSSSITLPGAGTYYLIIDTRSPSESVSYDLSINSFGTGAPNDRPYQAQAIPFNIPIGGNNSCSNNLDEPLGQPSCFAPSGSNPLNTVWFSFIAPASGSVKIRTNTGTLTNTQMAVYGPVNGTIAAGAGNTLSIIGCNQDLPPCGSNTYPSSQLSFTGLTAGSTYYISVDGYGGQTGSFSIFIMDGGPGGTLPFPPAPGQDCELAFPVCKTSISVANPGPQAVGNNCEFSSFTNCLLSGERGSYWYRISIVANGFLEFDIVPNDWPGAPSTAGTDYDFAVWRTATAGSPGPANCNNLATTAPVSCNYSYLGTTGCFGPNNGTSPAAYPGFGAAYQSRITVSAGDEYLLIVSNYTNSTSGFSLNFSAGSPIATVPPAGGTLIWTGTLSTDWYNPENWGGCAVPNCVYNVSIDAAPVNQPVITGATAVCGGMNITAGASLTLQTNSQLKVCNDFNNNGTLTALNNSTILMQSDSVLQNQSMSGSMTGTNKIWHLSVNKPSTAGGNQVNLTNDIDNQGNFVVGTSSTYQGGVFNTNGNYHKVAGNFTVYYASSPYCIYDAAGSTLEFNGINVQSYYNRGMLNNVLMNHSGPAVVLGNSGAVDWMSVNGTLDLTLGKIITGTNRVHVLNNSPAAVTPGNNSSFVQGYLKRALAPSGGTYDFPVGTSLRGYQRINFDFGSTNDRSSAMLSFANSAPATPLPVLGPECVTSYYDQPPLNHGYWQAEAIPATGIALYNVIAFNQNYTNAQTGFTIMTKHNAGAWGLEGTCNSASPITAVQRTGLSTFTGSSSYAIAQALTPLPVELLHLNAYPKVTSIDVIWATASEQNNLGFEVLRSTNPPEFTKIGWVNGSGNSNEMITYSFEDFNVEKNKVYYYRLRQVDFDGNFEFSEIVSARINGNNYSLFAMPNPYSGQTNISLILEEDAEVEIHIYSSIGQLVVTAQPNKQLTAGSYLYKFGAQDVGLAAGVYTAKVTIDGTVTYLRLLELR